MKTTMLLAVCLVTVLAASCTYNLPAPPASDTSATTDQPASDPTPAAPVWTPEPGSPLEVMSS